MRSFFGVLILTLLLADIAIGQTAADLVIVNGDVRTMSPKQPKAEAVAVIGNRIVAVGSDENIRKLISSATRVIDADGGTVLPGFNDSHVHFMAIGNKFSSFDLKDVANTSSFFEKLELYTRYLPKGRWILGSGGRKDLFNNIPFEKLDTLSPNNPVFIYGADRSVAIANSAALNAALIRDTRPGIISGPVLERVRHYVPADHTRRWSEIAETASNYTVSFGITSVHDTHSDDHAELYKELARNGRLKVRIYDCFDLSAWKVYKGDLNNAASESAMVRAGCLKGTAEVEGQAILDLKRDVIGADKAGSQVLLHAIGSRAIRVAVDVFEAAIRENGARDRRFRIEHAERAAVEDLKRMARLGIIASVQPYLFGGRMGNAGFYRSLMDEGIQIAFGSDAPMTEIDPLLTIQASVGSSGRIGLSIDEALYAHTVSSAYAEFREDIKGSLQNGMLADIVVLERTTNNTSGLVGRVLFTVVDGRVVYQAH
ncbi:amidohydrolase [Leptolyngbya sp. 7M]|uniref:amidohydrolase n=1 Tax=Leptolyngbya sp. 7M TaxID=2812896 RepID=UPI001B8B1018|nr:amidohydrolase family protein [Leptolyngbya sp. 7M]QYO66270.1 amidohydrolase family protein [Leptolyngbya sp. 7M]